MSTQIKPEDRQQWIDPMNRFDEQTSLTKQAVTEAEKRARQIELQREVFLIKQTFFAPMDLLDELGDQSRVRAYDLRRALETAVKAIEGTPQAEQFKAALRSHIQSLEAAVAGQPTQATAAAAGTLGALP